MTDTSPDVLRPLMDLSGVTDAAANARGKVDALLWDRRLQAKGTALAAQAALQAARHSAAIEGIDIPLSAWASGDAFDDSPLGRAAAGIWRLEQNLRGLIPVWGSAPLQALARMHTLVATDVIDDTDQLGRPRDSDEVDDPLRLKAVPPVDGMKVRLTGLAGVVSATPSVPAVVESAVVHAELLALRPFRWGSGPVARAAARLVLAHRGLDPDLLVMTDVAIHSIGRPAYVDALRAHQRADPESVARWLRFGCESVAVGARLSVEQLDQIK